MEAVDGRNSLVWNLVREWHPLCFQFGSCLAIVLLERTKTLAKRIYGVFPSLNLTAVVAEIR